MSNIRDDGTLRLESVTVSLFILMLLREPRHTSISDFMWEIESNDQLMNTVLYQIVISQLRS